MWTRRFNLTGREAIATCRFVCRVDANRTLAHGTLESALESGSRPEQVWTRPYCPRLILFKKNPSTFTVIAEPFLTLHCLAYKCLESVATSSFQYCLKNVHFLEKSITNMYGSTLLAFRGGAWVSNSYKKNVMQH